MVCPFTIWPKIPTTPPPHPILPTPPPPTPAKPSYLRHSSILFLLNVKKLLCFISKILFRIYFCFKHKLWSCLSSIIYCLVPVVTLSLHDLKWYCAFMVVGGGGEQEKAQQYQLACLPECQSPFYMLHIYWLIWSWAVPHAVGILIISILSVRKLRHRQVKWLPYECVGTIQTQTMRLNLKSSHSGSSPHLKFLYYPASKKSFCLIKQVSSP